MPRAAGRWALACLAPLLLPPAAALAHDPPRGTDLLFAAPEDDTPSVIVGNRGLVFVDGEGPDRTFRLRCNEALDISTAQGVRGALRDDDQLFLSVYHGAYTTADRACSLTPGAGLPEQNLSLAAASSDGLLVVTRAYQEGAQVFWSDDEGTSWAQRHQAEPGDYFEDLWVAGSDPSRVYASGLRIDGVNPTVPLCVRSEDGGVTWAVQTLDLPSQSRVFAVDPADPDAVFAYEPANDAGTLVNILRSTDACASFAPVLTEVSLPTSVARSSDGALWLGIEKGGGLYRSEDDGGTFAPWMTEEVNAVTCLEARGERLWMCANMAPNENGVWFSDDAGQTFEPFMVFADVSAPVACEDAEAMAKCERSWQDFTFELHPPDLTDAGVAEDASVPPDGAAAPDGGEPDGGQVADAGQPPGVVPMDAGAPPEAASGGCQVAHGVAAGGGGATWLAWLLLGAIGLRVQRAGKRSAGLSGWRL